MTIDNGVTSETLPDTLTRRRILGYAGAVTAIAAARPPQAAAQVPSASGSGSGAKMAGAGLIQLPPLPYDYAALEPAIDRETMVVHHDRHHQAYVDATNKALVDYPQLQGWTIEELLRRLNEVPEAIRPTIRNQGGGHVNHTLFWRLMTPGGSPVPADLTRQIEADFGSLDAMKTLFQEAGTRHFGSGWAFLVHDAKGNKLEILTLPNQDSVAMIEGKTAILGNDLWEHAYYLKYRNARAAYLTAWWSVVNWSYAGDRLAGIRAGKTEL